VCQSQASRRPRHRDCGPRIGPTAHRAMVPAPACSSSKPRRPVGQWQSRSYVRRLATLSASFLAGTRAHHLRDPPVPSAWARSLWLPSRRFRPASWTCAGDVPWRMRGRRPTYDRGASQGRPPGAGAVSGGDGGTPHGCRNRRPRLTQGSSCDSRGERGDRTLLRDSGGLAQGVLACPFRTVSGGHAGPLRVGAGAAVRGSSRRPASTAPRIPRACGSRRADTGIGSPEADRSGPGPKRPPPRPCPNVHPSIRRVPGSSHYRGAAGV